MQNFDAGAFVFKGHDSGVYSEGGVRRLFFGDSSDMAFYRGADGLYSLGKIGSGGKMFYPHFFLRDSLVLTYRYLTDTYRHEYILRYTLPFSQDTFDYIDFLRANVSNSIFAVQLNDHRVFVLGCRNYSNNVTSSEACLLLNQSQLVLLGVWGYVGRFDKKVDYHSFDRVHFEQDTFNSGTKIGVIDPFVDGVTVLLSYNTSMPVIELNRDNQYYELD